MNAVALLLHERCPIKLPANQRVEFPRRIVIIGMAADTLNIRRQRKVVAVRLINFLPRLVNGSFCIHHESIEIKDQGLEGGEVGCGH